MGLLEALAGETLVYLLQRAVVNLDLWFQIRLLSGDETGGGVNPLTGRFSLGRQDHNAVEQDGGGSVPPHLVEPDEVH